MKRTKISELFFEPDKKVLVKGWVRTKRVGKKIAFIELNDGSSVNNLQLVIKNDNPVFELLREVTVGSSLSVEGTLVESKGTQEFELLVENLKILGRCDPEKYPLQKKELPMEFLREIAHLRPRTKTFNAIFRVRHLMAMAVHEFFHKKGFVYVHTPIIASSDCEGAGEMFKVTTFPLEKVPKKEDGSVDFEKDFFKKPTFLTVSGQLEGELLAMGLGEIYTFGPTFRAENSNTTRHASEFWMIEPEMAFYELDELMDLEEEFTKFIVEYALNNAKDELLFLEEKFEPGLIKRLENVLENKFKRIRYEEAIKILQEAEAKGKKFEEKPSMEMEIGTEHERYLTEEHFKQPIILYDFPKEFKAFYMYLNEDNTVRGTDVLVPRIGEIIGGSEREWRLDILKKRMDEMGLDEKDYWWYLDTRKFGSVPHSGFGLGFERLIMFITGVPNIRDVIPFPRTPRNAEF